MPSDQSDDKTTRMSTVRLPGPEALDTEATQVVSFETVKLEVGSRIAERYRIVELLGAGGMGVVYRAHDDVLDVDVALKALRPEVAHDVDFLKRFRQELLLARQVTHRNVVRIHDIGEHDGVCFMTMDFVAGRSLLDLLDERGRLEPEEAVPLVRQVVEALAEAHRQGVVHRDLKPANILLDEGGNAYVTDFGVARSLHAQGMTSTGAIMGTPAYLSPEQARGEKVDGRSDLYTLGIILFQMVTGELPFRRGTAMEMLAQRMTGRTRNLEETGVEVPKEVAAIIRRCLTREVEERYQSAEELLADLEQPEKMRRRWRLSRRHRRVAAAVVGLLLLLAAGGLLLRKGLWPPLGSEVSQEEVAASARPLYSVAVLPFHEESARPDLAWASTGIAEMLGSSLAESESLRVVASLKVFQFVEVLGFEAARLRDRELEQLAQAFEVNRLVIGRVRSIADRVQLEGSLVEAEPTGTRVRVVYSESGELESLFEMVAALAATLHDELRVPSKVAAPAKLTASTVALEFYVQGLDYLSRGETLKAAPALRRAVEEDPDFAHAWVRLARAYQNQGRHEEALRAAEQAAAATVTTTSRVAYEARAQEALLRGDPEAAQTLLQELVNEYPNDTDAQVALAEAYAQQGRFAEAISTLKRTVEVDNAEPRAWYLLGRYSIYAGDLASAADRYLPLALTRQKTLRNEQGQAEVHNAMGVVHIRLGRLDEAVESLEEAAELSRRIGDQRGLAHSLQNLGNIDLRRGNHDEAAQRIAAALDIQQALGNREGVALAYTERGFLEENRGRYTDALEFYRRALQVRRELGDERATAESYNNVGYTYYLLGEYDNAIRFLESALQLAEKNEDKYGVLVAVQSLGSCQLDQGTWPEAQRSFLRALELSRQVDHPTEEAVSLGLLGRLAQYQGRYGTALASYGDALEIVQRQGNRRGQVEFHLRTAEALIEVGDFNGSRKHLDQAERLQAEAVNHEQRADLLLLRGQRHLAQGEFAAAAVLFAQGRSAAGGIATRVLRARYLSAHSSLAAGDLEAAAGEFATGVEEARRIGHAVLELQLREGLARALLELGRPVEAGEELRMALRRAEAGGFYAGAFRLHQLLARIHAGAGDTVAADRARAAALGELDRLRENLDEEQRRHFDALADVAPLRSGGEQRQLL